MDETPGRRFQFGLASLFAAMTLAALAMWARSLWWIPAVWAGTYLCGIVALAGFVAIIRIIACAGAHIARLVKKPSKTFG
jgi:hypothetical protein